MTDEERKKVSDAKKLQREASVHNLQSISKPPLLGQSAGAVTSVVAQDPFGSIDPSELFVSAIEEIGRLGTSLRMTHTSDQAPGYKLELTDIKWRFVVSGINGGRDRVLGFGQTALVGPKPVPKQVYFPVKLQY